MVICVPTGIEDGYKKRQLEKETCRNDDRDNTGIKKEEEDAMINRAYVLVLTAVLGGGAVLAQDDGDWQLWHTFAMEGKVGQTTVKMEGELRFGSDMSTLYYHHADVSFWRKVTEMISMGLAYRQVYENKHGSWEEENRPHVDAAAVWKVKDVKIKNRFRVEYRMRDGKKDVFRFRNKISVSPPFQIKGSNLKPFAADEIFIDDEGTFTRNRLYVGVKIPARNNVKVDAFYLWQTSKKSGDWLDFNVIGVKIGLRF